MHVSSPAVESEILLVGCKDDTIITVTQTVGITAILPAKQY